MQYKNFILLFFIFSIMIFFSCARTVTETATKQEINTDAVEEVLVNPAPVVEDAPGAIKIAGPPVIIYKTKNNYFDKVPVTLSEDKSMLVSYPAFSDLYYKGELALPTKLHNGYLLDNRGITKNVAFLNISYDSYSRFDMMPPTDLIFQMVIDDDPLIEMYKVGTRNEYQDIVNELNTIIDKKKLKKYTKIK